MNIVIINYGAGNINSVQHALMRCGISGVLSDDPAVIAAADKIIFPGVGEASSAMKVLKEKNLDLVIKDLQQPVLGICLGMQLLCKSTEEGNVSCLGIFNNEVKKFPADKNIKIPHVGWNSIKDLNSPLFELTRENEQMYFVHSYYASLGEHTTSVCSYGIDFSASLSNKNFHAFQFHPEKSGTAGENLIRNFIDTASH